MVLSKVRNYTMTEAVNNLAPSAPEKATKATPLVQAPERTLDEVINTPHGISLHNSQCKTFGEKAYSGVFDWGINFGVNLALSAAFTHYVKHSSKPIWKNASFGKGFFHEAPEKAFENVRHWMQKTTGFSDNTAARMADALTLTTAGTVVMIPSVWLGAKIKDSFVSSLDNWWYGKDIAQNDAWIQARHEKIENEPKATLAGAIVGRVGTMAAVQITAATIGSNTNMFKKLGDKTNIKWLQGFEGLDYYSKKIGHAAGTAIADAMPKASLRADKFAVKHHFVYSIDQAHETLDGLNIHKNGAKFLLSKDTPEYLNEFNNIRNHGVYSGALADYSRYTALDTMYTAVTMFTIHPIINAVKSIIPGMTYNNPPKEKPENKVFAVRSQGKIAYPEHSQGVSA